MGIVNPTMLEVYDDIPTELLDKVEDVLLNRNDNELQKFYWIMHSTLSTGNVKFYIKPEEWRNSPVEIMIA